MFCCKHSFVCVDRALHEESTLWLAHNCSGMANRRCWPVLQNVNYAVQEHMCQLSHMVLVCILIYPWSKDSSILAKHGWADLFASVYKVAGHDSHGRSDRPLCSTEAVCGNGFFCRPGSDATMTCALSFEAWEPDLSLMDPMRDASFSGAFTGSGAMAAAAGTRPCVITKLYVRVFWCVCARKNASVCMSGCLGGWVYMHACVRTCGCRWMGGCMCVCVRARVRARVREKQKRGGGMSGPYAQEPSAASWYGPMQASHMGPQLSSLSGTRFANTPMGTAAAAAVAHTGSASFSGTRHPIRNSFSAAPATANGAQSLLPMSRAHSYSASSAVQRQQQQQQQLSSKALANSIVFSESVALKRTLEVEVEVGSLELQISP
eukprot:1158122-Pelagomonas_calceolata.AAC.14